MKYKENDNQMRTNPLPRLGEGIYTPKGADHVGLWLVQHSLGPLLGPFNILRALALILWNDRYFTCILQGGTLERGSDLDVSAECPEVLGQGATDPSHQGRKIRKEKRCSKGWKKGVFHRLGDKGKSMSAYSNDSRHQSRRDTESYYKSSRSRGTEPASEKHYNKRAPSHKTKALSKSKGSAGGHWKSRSKKKRSSIEDDDLSQPWVCEETDLFTLRIRYFDLPKRTRVPGHVKTYDGSEDPEDHLKIFQAATKVERWVMPTWCHMFNSTLTGSVRVWFEYLPPKSVDGYDDLKEANLANFRQQKKCIKDPMEIHHIKQKEGEYTEDFVRRFKVEIMDMKGAPEIMRISIFLHGITNPELIKRLHDKFSKSVDEIMRITTSFLMGEVAAGNQERKKSFPPRKQQEAGHIISFPPLKEEEGTEGPMITEAKVRGHFIHRIKISSPYNRIIERPGVRKIQAVPSTTHIMLKFLVAGRVLTLRSSKIIPVECAAVLGPEGQPPAAHQAIEERIKVAINQDYPEQTILIGSTLTEEGRNKLCDLLQRCPPVRKKRRSQAADRNKDIQEEVEKLVNAGIMKEVHYHSCLSNPVMMPFGLRNAGATYQRLVDKAFHKQIGRNLEVYVDDLVIKSRTEDEIIRDIEETFKTLREINMKLNPKKCTLRVEEGMFLGRTKFKWKAGKLQQTEEAEVAFKQMKQLIAELPTLTAPKEKEELIIYLAAAKEAVSVVLMTTREAKKMSIYFISRALRGPKVNHTLMEKLVLALVHASKRLERYFQAHVIIVVTDQPIELGEYAIHYKPRLFVKGQILADFIVERPEENDPDTATEVKEELSEQWILFTDASSCVDGFGAGLILTNPEGAEFTYALRFRFEATNNEAEYEALIAGLRIAEEMGVKSLQANMDSRLVANQVNGTYIAMEADMI
nr:reverse transcriptase domain-containing protein [Tanacetum cinerariifolium]